MEYYTGVMRQNSTLQKEDSQNTWNFCLSMPQQFQPQCVRNHAFSLLYRSGDAFASAVHTCNQLSGELENSCIRSAGLFATQRARGSADAAQKVCDTLTDKDDYALCISSAAQEFIFERLPESSAQHLCDALAVPAKKQCTQGIAEMHTRY